MKAIFSPTGSSMYVLGFVTGEVFVYSLSTPWDVSTATDTGDSFDTSSQTTNPYAFMMDSTGSRLLAVSPSDVIYQYNLSSAGDVTTASYSGLSYNANSIDSSLYGLHLKPDDSKLFMVGAANNKVYTYSIDFGDITAPTISSLSPADNATTVSGDANLVLTFSESVDVESGNIVIKQTSDNLIIETIDVTGGLVTGTGTDTITVNPSTTLTDEIGYYVEVASTAFDDAASNSYAGIADSTTWNFTIAAATGGDAASSTNTASASVQYPTGGEMFEAGEEMEIEWSISNYT
ncbi:MAG: Ig-like domain-containing protein, partial [bacterium]|nr:Ig-like domain-containing protein [bacterium]